ncbi:MAG: SMC-Scp complex subunit ScpB [Candidatus Omnitrophota bacterium]
MDNIKAVIEALLFSTEKPLALEQIKYALGGLEAGNIRSLLEELKSEYETSNRGLRIIEIAGGFQMTTPADFACFLRKLHKERKIERLSKPALETLAIIAYKQPLTKFEVQALRNVNIDGLIANLRDKDFIRIVGRKDTPGRPFVFGTTRMFLEYFGLKSLDDLPKMDDFSKLQPANDLQAAAVNNKELLDETKKSASEN